MSTPFQYLARTYRLWKTRRIRARTELVVRLAALFEESSEYVLGGVHSWQSVLYPHPQMPALDVQWNDLSFSFLSPSPLPGTLHQRIFGEELLSASRVLLESFRRRLLQGEDLVPVLPIFLDPRHVLRLKDSTLFAVYLDQQWHQAVLWALRSLPAMPEHNEEFPLVPGTWASRRAYLEEAAQQAFFTTFLP